MSNQMADAVLASNKKKYKVLNPIPGGSEYTSKKRTAQLVRRERAYIDSCGHLVFNGQSDSKSRSVLNFVDRFSGFDAFPDRAVLPPSPEYLARLNSGRGPLRPPLRRGAR